MRAEMQTIAEQVQQSLALLRRHLDPDVARRRLDELNAKAEDPKFWNDSGNAQKLMRERNKVEKALADYAVLDASYRDTVEMIELAAAEGDAGLVRESEDALRALASRAADLEMQSLFSGEADGNDCYIEIHAGAGGTESQDWASMLLRMYTRWAERRDFRCDFIEESAGEEAGIKSATLLIKGENAFGWAKTESGVHRLVRISPFDSNARRHTSFASVWVYPVVDDTIEIDIVDKDLRIDTYRASGAGGQHVNKTESAIRITHMPSGIVVSCQNDRSQHKNRATAFAMLRSRLYELELEKREAAASELNASKSDIGWGHQIRSYVLQPYQLVKDLRTGAQSYSPKDVLDGELDPFMQASLAQRLKGGADAPPVEDLE
ncbi:MAG: peptide chain release factor 2 [Alphaproteobacteria bacterium]|nr:peptide chain release factor 2 [Alphaproteobacteria bacterium]